MEKSLDCNLVEMSVLRSYKIDRMLLFNRIIQRKNILDEHIHQLESILLDELIDCGAKYQCSIITIANNNGYSS